MSKFVTQTIHSVKNEIKLFAHLKGGFVLL